MGGLIFISLIIDILQGVSIMELMMTIRVEIMLTEHGFVFFLNAR